MQTFLETKDDMLWLKEVHEIDNAPEYACAILYGKEDYPDKVELFKENNIRCIPDVWVMNYFIDKLSPLLPGEKDKP
jgi:hypothetical protein